MLRGVCRQLKHHRFHVAYARYHTLNVFHDPSIKIPSHRLQGPVQVEGDLCTDGYTHEVLLDNGDVRKVFNAVKGERVALFLHEKNSRAKGAQATAIEGML